MGQCSFRPNPSTTTLAPELPADLVEEILLRFPPSEPASLVRAALVCKQWCRLISEPRAASSPSPASASGSASSTAHHPSCWDSSAASSPETEASKQPGSCPHPPFGHREPTSASAAQSTPATAVYMLLQCPGKASSESVLVVWDPISDQRRELPVPTRWGQASWPFGWNAAVLCAAAGPCDHLDCHRGPFLVVFVDSHCTRNRFISTYSSDSGTWSDRIFPLHPADYVSVSLLPCAHVGNALYFASEMSNTALKYDLCLHETSVIFIPSEHCLVFPYVLTTTEDGGLRYTVLDRSKLYMWSRAEDGPDVDARWPRDNGWTQDRVIELNKMLLLSNAIWASPCIVGFADGAGVIFFTADDVHFTVDLNTKKVKKVSKDVTVDKALPYMSFYTPALGASFMGEGPSEARSNE